MRKLIYLVFSAAALPLWAQPEVNGIWVLDTTVSMSTAELTPYGQNLQDHYDILTDDPSLNCVPASLSRVWANPNSLFEIDVQPDQVLISYELFDLRRTIPLDAALADGAPPSTNNLNADSFSSMGTSVAEINDDALWVFTDRHTGGFLRTSVGLPQGSNTTAIEKFWRDGEYLMLEITYQDDTLYLVPFAMTFRFARSNLETLPIYDCTDADYDWFELLNQQPLQSAPN